MGREGGRRDDRRQQRGGETREGGGSAGSFSGTAEAVKILQCSHIAEASRAPLLLLPSSYLPPLSPPTLIDLPLTPRFHLLPLPLPPHQLPPSLPRSLPPSSSSSLHQPMSVQISQSIPSGGGLRPPPASSSVSPLLVLPFHPFA